MLLIDRPMPKRCADCMCCDDLYKCGLTGKSLEYDVIWSDRMSDCPLVEMEDEMNNWNENYDVSAPVGWMCPRCGRILSPTTPVCIYCNTGYENTYTSSGTGKTDWLKHETVTTAE